jgi:hypothetical protein
MISGFPEDQATTLSALLQETAPTTRAGDFREMQTLTYTYPAKYKLALMVITNSPERHRPLTRIWNALYGMQASPKSSLNKKT